MITHACTQGENSRQTASIGNATGGNERCLELLCDSRELVNVRAGSLVYRSTGSNQGQASDIILAAITRT